ncbi:hypothetical protein EKE94_09030 [Mesobaculum littorinae]|uniref:DUF7742 domain-containing protein n=1 Tax=Mesobaculum littorinae TaxID=2486419 RepID=A0A438AKB4_9RHOB|nr:hypothetical protein [Mesobaculum littorinae]RVV99007.1 hypothetical protein EKE94_09030 [Mesobaculum littorinae]
MKPPRVGDALAAARALMCASEPAWRWRLARMIAEAGAAQGHARRHGAPHPRYGDGSLMMAALRRGAAAEPDLSDQRFARALVVVLEGLSPER